MIISARDPKFRQCAKTVMDNIADPDIRFDKDGVCNYYHEYQTAAKKGVFTGEAGRKKLGGIGYQHKE